MPFKSKAQRAWMHKNLPSIAKRWEREYSSKDILPKRVKPKTKNKLSKKSR
jgi:hypothetical protein|tara:strand:- start:6900 stop:7052 length:153 start_codon:yes stop_codon:yes gene_type:complete